MADRHFVLISLETKYSERLDSLRTDLDTATDWIEIKNNTWLIWTRRSARSWYGRLKPKLKKSERLFATRVDLSDRGGWMPRAFWDFIKQRDDES